MDCQEVCRLQLHHFLKKKMPNANAACREVFAMLNGRLFTSREIEGDGKSFLPIGIAQLLYGPIKIRHIILILKKKKIFTILEWATSTTY